MTIQGESWPTLKTYTGDELRKIAMPVGGIGTGNIGLAGNGALVNWEVMNRPALNKSPAVSAFLIRIEQEDLPLFTKVLEGPLDLSDYEGPFGAEVKNHGMPRFRKATFKSAYPFGQVELEDKKSPLKVTLQAFNPLIPSDAQASSYPIMTFRCVVENTSKKSAIVSVASNVSNFIRPRNSETSFINHNEYIKKQDYCAIYSSSEMTDPRDENNGDFSIAMLNPQKPTFRTSWADLTWRDSLLDLWDDFTDDGDLDERKSANFEPTGSLCDRRTILPGETEEFTFIISWYFPPWYWCALLLITT